MSLSDLPCPHLTSRVPHLTYCDPRLTSRDPRLTSRDPAGDSAVDEAAAAGEQQSVPAAVSAATSRPHGRRPGPGESRGRAGHRRQQKVAPAARLQVRPGVNWGTSAKVQGQVTELRVRWVGWEPAAELAARATCLLNFIVVGFYYI